MTPEDIQRLSLAAHRAGIAELDVTADGISVRLRLSRTEASDAADLPLAAPAAAAPQFRSVVAPAVGIFRARHPITSRAPVAEGQAVAKGQIVAFLQVGSALRPVMAPAEGVLGSPMAADGAVVGYGTQLFALS